MQDSILKGGGSGERAGQWEHDNQQSSNEKVGVVEVGVEQMEFFT